MVRANPYIMSCKVNKKKLNGVVSVSETFIVNSLEELKISPDRACIGSTVTITNETEEFVDELPEP